VSNSTNSRCHLSDSQVPLTTARGSSAEPSADTASGAVGGQLALFSDRKGVKEVAALTEPAVREAVVAHLVKPPAPSEVTDQIGRTGWSSAIRPGGGLVPTRPPSSS
jgi:hypothetical protein